MKINKYILSAILAVSLVNTSCTDGFDRMNINPEGQLEEGFFDAPNYISTTIQYSGNMNFTLKNGAWAGGAHLQERIKLLQIDGYAQYTTGNYNPNDSWVIDYWGAHYISYLKVINKAIEGADIYANKDNLKAYGLIWRTYMQSTFVDYFGTAPYPLSANNTTPEYQSLESQHKQFFADLDEAIPLLTSSQKLLTTERVYNGDVVKWRRFANSLRLRLAVKLSEIDPVLSKAEIAKAINGTDGLLREGDDATAKPYELWGNNYPYSVITWGNNKLTTSMEKTLTNIGGANIVFPASVIIDSVEVYPAKIDPRALEMFDFSAKYNKVGQPVTEKYQSWKGMNGAMANAGGFASTVSNMSQTNFIKNDFRNIEHITYAEVCFLLAEVYERNLAAGNAQEWYEKGVKESFRKHNMLGQATAYLASIDKNGWGTSAKYGDNTGAGNTNLEKIVAQRYIAFYPDMSLQIWNDKRRLNLPAMDIFEVRNMGIANWPIDNDIKNPLNFMQRHPFPTTEKGRNEERYEEGITILNAESNGVNTNDGVLTPLWWASKKANYCTSNP